LDEGISDLDSNCSSSSFEGDSSLGEQSPAKSNKNDMDAIQERDSEYSQKDEDEVAASKKGADKEKKPCPERKRDKLQKLFGRTDEQVRERVRQVTEKQSEME